VIHYHLQAALAAQRREDLRADMQAARWPEPGRPRRRTTAAHRQGLRRVAGWLTGENRLRPGPRNAANSRPAAADNVAVERSARNVGADRIARESATVTYQISLDPRDEPAYAECLTCVIGQTRREATRVFHRPPGLRSG
jgi:hypothetical protein